MVAGATDKRAAVRLVGMTNINWNGDAESAPFKSRFDDESENLILAETDTGTGLFEWDGSAWQFRGPVEMNDEDVSGVGTLSATDVVSDSLSTDKINGEDSPERLFFDTYNDGAVDESITVDLPRSGETAVIIDFSLADVSTADPVDISLKLDGYDGSDYDYRLKDGLDDTVPVTGDTEFVLTSGRGNRPQTGTFVIKNGENGRPTIYGDGSAFESDGVRSVLAFGCLEDGLTDPITSVDIEGKSGDDDWNGYLLVNEVERS